MDLLIYFCGILTDLVVAGLNPDRPPSLLKSTRFRGCHDKSHTAWDILLSGCVPCVSSLLVIHTGNAASPTWPSVCALFNRVWVQDCKVALFTPRLRRARGPTSACGIDLFSPGYSLCSTKMYSLHECEEEEMQPASLNPSPSPSSLSSAAEVESTAFAQCGNLSVKWKCLSALSLTGMSVNL